MSNDNKPNIFDDNTVGEYVNIGALGIGGLASMVTGAFGLLVGFTIDENLPLDDTPRDGQVQALEQYNTMLTDLSAQYNAIQGAQSETASIPVTLQNYTASQENESRTAYEIESMRRGFNSLASDFAVSILIDPRLNEEDTEELHSAFEKRVGDFKTLTGYRDPDFGDLNYCRPASLENVTSDHSLARSVNNCAGGDNIQSTPVINTAILGGLSLPLLLFLGFLGKEWAQSKRGLNLARRKPKH